MSSLADLDRSNVVEVDLGNAEFKANAHRYICLLYTSDAADE